MKFSEFGILSIDETVYQWRIYTNLTNKAGKRKKKERIVTMVGKTQIDKIIK